MGQIVIASRGEFFAGSAFTLTIVVIGIGPWALGDNIAVMTAPKKKPFATRSEAASNADDLYWETFHKGESRIGRPVELLTSAYLRTPNDAKTAAHIALRESWTARFPATHRAW